MAQLPPKIPNMPPTWADFSSYPFNVPSMTSIAPTATAAAPSWMDEFLDFSTTRCGAHRRSLSDSIAFLEAPGHRVIGSSSTVFDKFDDEQLMSMFTDDNAGAPSSSPSTPSEHNSINDDDKAGTIMATNLEKRLDEVQSQCDSETTTHPNPAGAANSGSDRPIDPKRVKRILANRQSAQRSRVRRLQYISELERSVTSLQTEVSVLSPRIAFLDHQRLLLNVDNSAIKQRIAALAQDKIFKDAHQEALKREIERLRQVYHQQNLQKMENNNAPAPDPTQPHATEKEQQLLQV